MAYTITRTNGLNPVVIPDGTLNTETSVILVGKNYPNYGNILDQNFLRLLENSANSTAPSAPITGEIWWKSDDRVLKVWTGSVWKNVGSTTSSATKPATSSSNVGDLWWDTTGAQLWAYDGNIADYKLIGPIGGAGGIDTTPISDGTNDHDVISFTIGGDRYAIISIDATFTPNPSINGFQTIKPGINLANTSFLRNAAFVGQATDSVTLNGLASSSFIRSDQNTGTTGTLSVLNNNGLYVGASSQFHVATSGGNSAVINETNGGYMNFKVRSGGGTYPAGTLLDAMDIYPNGNVVANYDFTVMGNISFANTSNDLVITGLSPSYNPSTGALRLSVGGLGVAGNINTGGSQNHFVGNVQAANINSNAVVSGTNIVGTNFYGTVQTASQPNITSIGQLSTLVVTGSVGSATSTYTGLLTVNAQPYITSVGTLTGLTSTGTVTFSGASSVLLGSNSNVKITGGTSGQYMVTDGAGNISWSSITGSNNQVPYFQSGILAGSSSLTYNGSTLAVTGAITSTGDITAYYTSDARLKTDLVRISNALDKVNALNGFTFNWNELSGKDQTVREAGVIAQEVQAVVPEVVVERDNGYLAVNYEKLVPLLIEAIKELKAEVEVLKAAK